MVARSTTNKQTLGYQRPAVFRSPKACSDCVVNGTGSRLTVPRVVADSQEIVFLVNETERPALVAGMGRMGNVGQENQI
jgi:hypothetical protein